MKRYFLLFLLITVCSFPKAQDLPKGMTEAEIIMMENYIFPTTERANNFPPSSSVRAMAEWEEQQAISISWKSYNAVLAEIVRHAQNECRVIINCTDSNSVKNYLISFGIFPNENVEYLIVNTNSVWIRDYGSYSVYKEDVDSLYLIDWVYNRPRPLDDVIPQAHANYLNLPLFAMTQSPYKITHTGGNLMFDGFGTAFSSKLVIDENISFGHDEASIDTIMKQFMGVDRYVKFEVLPHDGIHHIDMHMKLLDEETLLVGYYPEGVSDGPQIEANINYLMNNHLSVFGTPYKIVRIPMLPNQAGNMWPSDGSYYRTYTNGVFVNKSFLYPSYYEKYDTTAYRIYKELLPGYNIVPIHSDPDPISASGAIHCITNNIGVADPIVILHQKLSDTYNQSDDYAVVAMVNHISGIENLTLFYRTDTLESYTAIPMGMTYSGENMWAGYIPAQEAGNSIYYYIEANAVSGKTLVRPITAPAGYWKFDILGTPDAIEEFSRGASVHRLYPNPAKAITCVEIEFDKAQNANIYITDMLGKKLEDVHYGEVRQGLQNVFFDASNLTNGIYFVIIETKQGRSVAKFSVSQ